MTVIGTAHQRSIEDRKARRPISEPISHYTLLVAQAVGQTVLTSRFTVMDETLPRSGLYPWVIHAWRLIASTS